MLLLEVLLNEAPFSCSAGDTKYWYSQLPKSWVIKSTKYLGRYEVLTQLKDVKADSGNILKVQKKKLKKHLWYNTVQHLRRI